jgi:hypothetical protein
VWVSFYPDNCLNGFLHAASVSFINQLNSHKRPTSTKVCFFFASAPQFVGILFLWFFVGTIRCTMLYFVVFLVFKGIKKP